MERIPVTKALNDKMDTIANSATQEFPGSCVICLVIDSEGNAHYVSNLSRADAIDSLEVFLEELRGQVEEPTPIEGVSNWPFPTGTH